MGFLNKATTAKNENDEIEYVFTTSQKKESSLNKIEVGEATSIFTKLKEYPYEFEIDSSLRLASIKSTGTHADNIYTMCFVK